MSPYDHGCKLLEISVKIIHIANAQLRQNFYLLYFLIASNCALVASNKDFLIVMEHDGSLNESGYPASDSHLIVLPSIGDPLLITNIKV